MEIERNINLANLETFSDASSSEEDHSAGHEVFIGEQLLLLIRELRESKLVKQYEAYLKSEHNIEFQFTNDPVLYLIANCFEIDVLKLKKR